MKTRIILLIGILAVIITGCNKTEGSAGNETIIELNTTSAMVNDKKVAEYNYSWHSNPSKEKAWYEGTEPDRDVAVYIAHDIWYYPQLDEEGFSIEEYDGEQEWVYHYTAEGLTDYIYSTLPVQGETIPSEMMHSEKEAFNNPVLHIVKPGTYRLKGKWNGQIMIDLGDRDDTFADADARVKIILDNADVSCSCAPAFIAYSAYECDNTWKMFDEHGYDVNTDNAGVSIVIGEGSVNSFEGSNIFRMLKPVYKNDNSTVQKKALKIDGAFYSFVSMNIDCEQNSGILNITSGFEGLDSELHLTINGGNINIYAQNDGINVNEENVSVFTMNDGRLHLFAGLGAEGDVVDSNGFIVINGGLIAGGTPSMSDEILDSDCGNIINGGEVINIGSKDFDRPGDPKRDGGPGKFDGLPRPDKPMRE